MTPRGAHFHQERAMSTPGRQGLFSRIFKGKPGKRKPAFRIRPTLESLEERALLSSSNLQLNVPATADEGSVVTLSGSFDDPNPADTHSVVIQWGCG
jgi:hypothetical protein